MQTIAWANRVKQHLETARLLAGGASVRKACLSVMIFSNSFHDRGPIPIRHTCHGRNISPALAWIDVPKSSRSLVFLMEDPDTPDPRSPSMTWVHWILYNMSPLTVGIPEGVTADELPPGTLQGMNDWKHVGYGGPCPPFGQHRYFHRLLALDTLLPDLGFPNRLSLERAMRGHIVAQAELIGLYESAVSPDVGDLAFRTVKLTWVNYGHHRH